MLDISSRLVRELCRKWGRNDSIKEFLYVGVWLGLGVWSGVWFCCLYGIFLCLVEVSVVYWVVFF